MIAGESIKITEFTKFTKSLSSLKTHFTIIPKNMFEIGLQNRTSEFPTRENFEIENFRNRTLHPNKNKALVKLKVNSVNLVMS